MEEADVLCTRIGFSNYYKFVFDLGIINDGILRCVAPQVRLKSLYGGGYHIYINCFKEKYLNKRLDEED